MNRPPFPTVDRRLAAPLAAVTGALVVLVLLATTSILPRQTPFGIIVLGVVLGGLNALLAIGIILVYRTNRVINFAHGELGAFAGVLTAQLIASGWNYFLAAGAGILAGLVAAVAIELLVIRRFAGSPRLILTVATIGLSLLLVAAELVVPRLFSRQVLSSNFRTPLSGWRFRIDPVTFDGNHVMIVVFALVVVVALGVFLRTDFGVAVRAAAENTERAALCGIPLKTLSTLVWAMAGVLSAAAAILQGPVVGLQVGVLIGPSLLLRALAAAVIGRMSSLPVTVVAAMGLAVLEQAVFWSYGRSTVIDATLLVVILVGLLLQRRTFSRTDPVDASTWQAVAEVRPVPAELAVLPEVRWARRVLVAVGTAVVVAVPWAFFSPSRQNLAAVVVIFAIVGVSLVVLTGWAGQISLGQLALVGIGGAVAGSVSADRGWDFVLCVVAGGAAGMVAALVLGVPALRVRGFFLAVTTLAFAVTTSSYLLKQAWLVPDGAVARPNLFGRIDLESELAFYYLCVAVLVAVIVAVRGLRGSRMGRAIVGIRDNERAAQSYGVNAIAAKLSAFGVSGFISGIAGALLVHHQHGLPATQYAPQQSLSVFLLAVIGGLGSVPGAILGAVYVKGAQYLLQGPGQFFASGIGVLFLLLFLPNGLGSLVFAIRDAGLRRIAARRGIVVASLLADRRVDELSIEARDDELLEEPLGRSLSPVEVPA